MTTAVSEARDVVYKALTGAVAGSPWRVHRTAAVQPSAPNVFIDSPTLSEASSIITISFPVVIVVDGAVDAQINALDDLVAKIWTALSRIGNPVDSRPVVLDLGGINLRAQIVNVDLEVAASTLCPINLTTVSA